MDEYRDRGRRVRVTDPRTRVVRVGAVDRTLPTNDGGIVYEVDFGDLPYGRGRDVRRLASHERVEFLEETP